ncbi:MAG: hypothetical protein ACXWZZ_14690 [Solirubrobacteraceae bacterium]
MGLAWTGGMTAFLLTGGIVSDRVERRRVLIAADLARALVLLVTGVLSLAGVLEIWHLVALAVVVWGTPMSSRCRPSCAGACTRWTGSSRSG